jgi:serine protease Do
MSGAFGEIAEQLRRVTLQVLAGNREHRLPHGRGSERRTGRGSGVIWSQDGQVVTNAHVLVGNRVEVELWSGQRFPASIRSVDRQRDLAALQVNAGVLDNAVHGDSDALRSGELVIAVGSPYGFIGAVSTGVIHSVGAQVGVPARRWVASDVRLAPGNSGGPLANAKGEIIGLNTMIAGGLSLAIPSNVVGRFLAGSLTGRPYFGVTMRPVPLDPGSGQVGFLILEIADQSPAEQASLLPGDLLTGAEGRPFVSPEDLEDALGSSLDGQLEIEFRRGTAHQVRRVIVQLAAERVRAA